MQLTVLMDNNTIIDRYLFAEPGLSFLIEDKGKKFLFDTGYSDLFIKNATKMGIDLLDTDSIIISHGHLDHTGGLEPLVKLYTEAKTEGLDHKKPELLAHPLAFVSKWITDFIDIGSLLDESRIRGYFDLHLSSGPVFLTENLVFLGEIKRINNFEGQTPIGSTIIDRKEAADYLRDDTALAYRTAQGLIIITGCSHAGICNIIEQAKRVLKEDRVIDIIGGLHLLDPSAEQLDGTLDYLKRLQPAAVHACHCTDLSSKIAISKVVNLIEVGVGLRFAY